MALFYIYKGPLYVGSIQSHTKVQAIDDYASWAGVSRNELVARTLFERHQYLADIERADFDRQKDNAEERRGRIK